MHRPSHEGRASVVVLCLSACLNILLVAGLLRFGSKPASVHLASTNSPTVEIVQTQWVSKELPSQVAYATNHFHWSEIESTNYAEYIAGLRSVGCPEKTVRDIVLPEIEEYFDRRKLALMFNQGTFWMAGRQRRTAERERDAQIKQLRKDEELMIEKLLGIDWVPQEEALKKENLMEQALARFILGPMSEDTFERTANVMSRSAVQIRDLHGRANGIYTDEDEAKSRELETKLREDMLRVLSQAQYDEMRARTMAMELIDHTFEYTDGLTATEARQIALARADAYDFSSLWGDPDRTEEDRTQSERAFTNRIVQVLGPNRFADYQRSQDSSFREIVDFTKDNNLPRAKAVEVYDMRRLAAEEVSRLRADGSLEQEERRQQFDRIQTEIQRAVAGALGEEAYRQYLSRNGRWMTNLTNL